MLIRTVRAGALLGAVAILGAACGGGASVTAQPASAPDLESGDPSASPGILGGEQTESTAGNGVSLEAPVVEITKDGAVVSDATGVVSGEIKTVGQLDTYTFEASDDQTIYLVESGGCSITGGDSLGYEFKGAASTSGDFADVGDKIDCDKISDVRTESSGTVQLTITSENDFYGDESAVGKYSFQIVIVPDPTPVPISLGEVVSPDSPQVGAGHIEHLGQTDLYTFPVTAETVYAIVGQGDCKVENGEEFRFDIDGIADDWIDGSSSFDEQSADGDCNEVYVFAAEETGTARMQVEGEDANATGTYSFLVQEADSSQYTPSTTMAAEEAADEAVEDALEEAADGVDEAVDEAVDALTE